jgi:hypothetical protein
MAIAKRAKKAVVKAKVKAPAARRKRRRLPFYNQSTDFTCGAASLLMAMRGLDKDIPFDRVHELQVWREANTVYMGAGHPGSSPYGIALAAWRRGFHAEIWVSHPGAVLLDYQKKPEWRKAGKLVQDADAASVRDLGMPIERRKWDVADLAAACAEGAVPIVLVSTGRFMATTPRIGWSSPTATTAKSTSTTRGSRATRARPRSRRPAARPVTRPS